MPRRALAAFLSLSLVACSDAGTKTPAFADDEILGFTGRFLDANGAGVAGSRIILQNFRHRSFIDPTQALVDSATFALIYPSVVIAWFFPIYLLSWGRIKPDLPPRDSGRQKAGYYFGQLVTDADGRFNFRIRAASMLRDSDGNINVDIVNDSPAAPFGKFSLVVTSKTSEVGDVTLCTLGGLVVEEGDSDVTVSWQAPAIPVAKYHVNIGTQASNALVWSVEADAAATSVTLPKVALGDLATKVAVQAFTTFEDDRKVSCLTPTVDIALAAPAKSLAAGALGAAPGIGFKLSSLTNGLLDDSPYLEAFGPSSLTLDLGEQKTIRQAVLHNLLLAAVGTLTVETSLDGLAWSTAGQAEERRFLAVPLADGVEARHIRFTFSHPLTDLKEVTLQ